MQTINSNGFYLASDMSDTHINISKDIEIYVYDEDNKIQEISVGENTILHYFGLFSEDKKYNKLIHFTGENATVHSKNLALAAGNNVEVTIRSCADKDKAIMNTDIVTFASKSSLANIDGSFEIPTGVKGASGYLDEENIFLGTGAKIRAIPTLLVETNDMTASHACKIHKISEDKLFYLRSRGISKEDSTSMIIESFISKIFGEIEELDSELYLNIKDSIVKSI